MTKTQLIASLDAFTAAYIECALWSSTADGSPRQKREDPNHEGTFDASFQTCGYSACDLSVSALRSVIEDCKAFQADNAETLERWYDIGAESEERAGHDFWLTRNRHGAGYWDKWSAETPAGVIGHTLTELAHAYGEQNWYVARGKVEIE